MQGNRVTQMSGLVRVLYCFSLRGVDGKDGLLLLFQLFIHVCSLSFLPANPVPPSPKFPSPSQQCLNDPTELGFPLVFAHLPNLCVVCHSVNVYWFSFLLHTTQSPSDLQSTSCTFRHPLCISVGHSFLGMDGPFPVLRFFEREAL